MKTKNKDKKKGKKEEDYFGTDKPNTKKGKSKNVAKKVLKATKVMSKDKPKKKEKWVLDEKPVKNRLTEKQFQKRINPATGRFEAVLAVPFPRIGDLFINPDDFGMVDKLLAPEAVDDDPMALLTDVKFELLDASRKKQIIYVIVTADPSEVLDVINPPPKAPTPANMEGTQTDGTKPDGSHYMNPSQVKETQKFAEGTTTTTSKANEPAPKMTAVRNEKYIIPAEVKAGDMLIAFDSMPFFRDGAPEDVVGIAELGWEDVQNETTDTLVDFIMGHDKRVGSIHDVDEPYTLTVDVQAAKTWLEKHRPDVYEKVAD